jgi:thiamine biosynthesis lipoprotein
MIGDRLAKCLSFCLCVAALRAAPPALAAEPADPATGDGIVERSGTRMGTAVRLTAWTHDEAGAARAMEAALAEFERLDRMMTTWLPDSEVSRINAAAGNGEPIPVSDELLTCIVRGQEAARISGGTFDLTIGGFSGVWKFDEDNDGTIPPPRLVAERKRLVGWRDLIVDREHKTVRLRRKGMRITLGGIAKGYAVDRAAAILRQAGLSDFIVQAGGDMMVSGRRGDRRWRVGIRDPRGPRDRFFAAAEVEDHTFSTSGDYERFTVKGGRRYHHIIDPRTGYPATRCRSVTIMAKDAITAEVLSKIVFIWGAERGLAFVKKQKDVEAVVVDARNKVHVTPGLAPHLIRISEPTPGP